MLARALLPATLAALTVACAPRQAWRPVPMVTPDIRASGHAGGEGGQWPRAIVAGPDGEFVLLCIDVGGLFRSLDGGRSWEPCNVGYTPRGACSAAIDPGNPDRVVVVGANSVSGTFHGLWLSTDRASSWRQVLPVNMGGLSEMRGQLAFDPATRDPGRKLTRVVYWSRADEDKPAWGSPEVHPAMYRSDDGGDTWKELPGTAEVGGSEVRVHPARGFVYAANRRGLFRSTDGGSTWVRVLEGAFRGLDVSPGAPDRVWASDSRGIWRSEDSGSAFSLVPGSASLADGKALVNVRVSPADPERLLVWKEAGDWWWPRFASHDGGRTWTEAKRDATHAFLPWNARQGLFAWHPKDGSVAWSIGGDWPTRSDDGGLTWRWSADGDNAIFAGGMWNFCSLDPDVMYFGSQDYNGALTTDGGRTWKYCDISGNGWGGFAYGGYAASRRILYAGNADGWGGKRHLKVSFDGGMTFTETGHIYGGADVSLGDPRDPQVLFASDLRSGDGGKTWERMPACEGVYTANSGGERELYGKKGDHLVVSRDHGKTWERLATVEDGIGDIAVDHVHGRVYVASADRLKVVEAGKVAVLNTPPDQFGSHRIRTVAVDPVDPAVVYAGTGKDIYSASNSVVCSIDAGKTWTVLTRSAPLDGKGLDGGREANCIRVHPKTRDLWVFTGCYGLWRYGKP